MCPFNIHNTYIYNTWNIFLMCVCVHYTAIVISWHFHIQYKFYIRATLLYFCINTHVLPIWRMHTVGATEVGRYLQIYNIENEWLYMAGSIVLFFLYVPRSHLCFYMQLLRHYYYTVSLVRNIENILRCVYLHTCRRRRSGYMRRGIALKIPNM